LEITDADSRLINQQSKWQPTAEGWWLDTGKKRRLVRSESAIFDTCLKINFGEVDAQSQGDRRVEIGSRSRVINCTLCPVVIGNDCYLEKTAY